MGRFKMGLWGDERSLEGRRRAIKAEYCEMLLLAGGGICFGFFCGCCQAF